MDLWGLGATLFAAVEGRGPFHRADAQATLNAVVNEPIPVSARAGLLRPVIEGLLERDPGHRLGAPAVRMLLAEVLRQMPAPGVAPSGTAAQLDVTDLDTAALAVRQAAPEQPPVVTDDVAPAASRGRWTRPFALAASAAVLVPAALVSGVWAYAGEQRVATPSASTQVQAAASTQPAPAPTFATFDKLRLLVPTGWNAERFDGGLYLRESGTSRFIAVRSLGKTADLAAAVHREESAVAKRLPGYVRVTAGSPAAAEFSWLPKDGGALRVRLSAVRLPNERVFSVYCPARPRRGRPASRPSRRFFRLSVLAEDHKTAATSVTAVQ